MFAVRVIFCMFESLSLLYAAVRAVGLVLAKNTEVMFSELRFDLECADYTAN